MSTEIEEPCFFLLSSTAETDMRDNTVWVIKPSHRRLSSPSLKHPLPISFVKMASLYQFCQRVLLLLHYNHECKQWQHVYNVFTRNARRQTHHNKVTYNIGNRCLREARIDWYRSLITPAFTGRLTRSNKDASMIIVFCVFIMTPTHWIY